VEAVPRDRARTPPRAGMQLLPMHRSRQRRQALDVDMQSRFIPRAAQVLLRLLLLVPLKRSDRHSVWRLHEFHGLRRSRDVGVCPPNTDHGCDVQQSAHKLWRGHAVPMDAAHHDHRSNVHGCRELQPRHHLRVNDADSQLCRGVFAGGAVFPAAVHCHGTNSVFQHSVRRVRAPVRA
jgi:hypothetical protein